MAAAAPSGKGKIAAVKAASSSSSAAAGGGVKAAVAIKSSCDASNGKAVAASMKKQALHGSDIYVRIRPLAAEGGHSEDGTKLEKHLEGWDDSSVTIETQYLFSKGANKYAYPRRVFGTDASQSEVTDTMVPGLVDSFTTQKTSVLFFAYGQTGTGKTRTMLGTEPSLASAEPHEDWGVFPRVCALAFERIAEMEARGISCLLTASAIEFYLGECFDLLSSTRKLGNTPVQIDVEHRLPTGEQIVVLERPSDLMGFLAKVLDNRTARSTNFNKATVGEHSGSSRSHAALILTLMQLDKASREYLKTTFTLVDLAGAERPDKVREEVTGGGMNGLSPEFLPNILAARDAGSISQEKISKMIPLNFQTRVINFELFDLAKEVLKATEAHRKGKPFNTSPHSTPTIKFLSAILDGKARLAMMVTLSPAGRNAWETWFSRMLPPTEPRTSTHAAVSRPLQHATCLLMVSASLCGGAVQYGADLAKLHAPRRPAKAQDVDKLHKQATKEAAALQKEVDAMATGHRYYAQKKLRADAAAEALRRLEMLLGRAGKSSTAEGTGPSPSSES